MADKMMRIAGRTDGGVAKALRASNEGNVGINLTENIVEEVLGTDITLAKANGLNYSFDMGDFEAYRILVAPTQRGASIEVRALTNYTIDESAAVLGSTFDEPIIRSFGNGNVVLGNTNVGTSLSANVGKSIWSDIITPLRKTQTIRMSHSSTSSEDSLTFNIAVIKYRNVSLLNSSLISPTSKFNTTSLIPTIMDFRRSENVAKNAKFPDLASEDALIYDKPVVIDEIMWQTNQENVMEFRVEIKKGVDWLILNRNLEKDSSAGRLETPARIVTLGSSMWNVMEYDIESQEKFVKFSLRKPIHAPEGIRMYFENKTTTENAYQAGVVVKGRYL